MAMPGVTLGTANSTTIVTAKLTAGVFNSIGETSGSPSYSLTQITLTHSYARLVPANSGFPRVTMQRPAIDDVASQNGGTVASGQTVWAWTVEASALIAASAATATGVVA